MTNKAQSELIKRYRARLIPIIASVIYLGRQGLAFRGHRDDSKYLSDPNNNPGNFQALLGLLQDQSPEVRSLFDDAPRNATYHSKTIQNQIIDIIGDMIAECIIKEVKNAQFFSILADEASDISNKEQLSLVLRFVDENNEIREEFICFLHCDSGLSGESLAKLIMDKTHELGLSMDKCQGQGYDGAGSMAGRVKGVAARISAIYKFAVYTHCFSHALDLSVMRIINVKYVKEMFDNCKVISEFFNNSPKRYELFSTILKQTVPDATTSTKLINICRTRWVERSKGIQRFKECYKATVLTLERIKDNVPLHGASWNVESQRTASGPFHYMKKFEFVATLVICCEIMGYLSALTVSLQGPTLAIVEAYESVADVIETLGGIRLSVDAKHHDRYQKAVELAATVGLAPNKVRTCNIQIHRENMHANKIDDYYRRTVTLPCLNGVIADLERRFDPEKMSLISGFYCIPVIMQKYPHWKSKVREFMQKYTKGMVCIHSCDAELDLWETLWFKENITAYPGTVQGTLSNMMTGMFPNIHRVLILLRVSPVTTCSCERSISEQRRLKTYLRSTMVQDRYNALALMQIHYGMDIDHHDVLDRLNRKYPKRLLMVNVLGE